MKSLSASTAGSRRSILCSPPRCCCRSQAFRHVLNCTGSCPANCAIFATIRNAISIDRAQLPQRWTWRPRNKLGLRKPLPTSTAGGNSFTSCASSPKSCVRSWPASSAHCKSSNNAAPKSSRPMPSSNAVIIRFACTRRRCCEGSVPSSWPRRPNRPPEARTVGLPELCLVQARKGADQAAECNRFAQHGANTDNGAGLGLDLVGPAGQEHDGRLWRPLGYLACHLFPTDVWKAQIRDDHIKRLFRESQESLLSIRSDAGPVTELNKPGSQKAANTLFIFHDENAQAPGSGTHSRGIAPGCLDRGYRAVRAGLRRGRQADGEG